MLGGPGQKQFVRFCYRTGISDIIGMMPKKYGGRFMAIECKMPGKKPTLLQAEFLAMVDAMGGFACWVTSVQELQQKLAIAMPD